jgi:hypothetical protein
MTINFMFVTEKDENVATLFSLMWERAEKLPIPLFSVKTMVTTSGRLMFSVWTIDIKLPAFFWVALLPYSFALFKLWSGHLTTTYGVMALISTAVLVIGMLLHYSPYFYSYMIKRTLRKNGYKGAAIRVW